jgi:sensor histidine kinase YesM
MTESFNISRDYAESYAAAQRLSQQLMENDRLKDTVRRTEMAFLQSQIKPHFLYNTLSEIDEFCVVDPKEASRLINAFSIYLRQSFDFENLESNVPIEKELLLVSTYVEIERERFDHLTVEIVKEYQQSFLLPPLSIQPLIENAIRHGVRKKRGDGLVVTFDCFVPLHHRDIINLFYAVTFSFIILPYKRKEVDRYNRLLSIY